MVYTERAETAAVSCGTSHSSAVSTPLMWIFKNALYKASHSQCRVTFERSESARERRTALYKSDQQQQQIHTQSSGAVWTWRCVWPLIAYPILPPVPNKPCVFCGRKAPRKKKDDNHALFCIPHRFRFSSKQQQRPNLLVLQHPPPHSPLPPPPPVILLDKRTGCQNNQTHIHCYSMAFLCSLKTHNWKFVVVNCIQTFL